jgi:hypothetical protein
MQSTIDSLTITEVANNRTIDDLRNAEKINKQTKIELGEQLKKCEKNVDKGRNPSPPINPAPLRCGQQEDVSTCKVEAIFFFFYGATARGGPWAPFQYTSKALNPFL